MKKLMNLIVLSCRKATYLLEKSLLSPLPFMDRLQLKMHLKICDKCAAYQKQSLIIEALLEKAGNISDFSSYKFSSNAKERIGKALTAGQNES